MADINELFSPEALKSIEQVDAFFSKLVTTVESLIAEFKSMDQSLGSMKATISAQQDYVKVTNDVVAGTKKLTDAEKGLIEAKVQYNKILSEQRALAKANNVLQDEEAGYIEKLRATISKLNQEKAKLKENDANFEGELKRINKELDTHHQALLKTADAYTKQKTNIGAYTQSIKNAVTQIVGIAAPAAAAAFALNGLKEAFAGTEAGANLLGRAKLQMKAFFDAIVEGRWRYAFGNELPKDIKEIADLQNQVRIQERTNIEQVSAKEKEIKDLRLDAVKAGKDSVEQVKLLALAEQKENELIDLKVKQKQLELYTVNALLEKDPVSTEYLDKKASLEAEINGILGDRSLRIASKLEAAEEKSLANAKERADEERKLKETMDKYESDSIERGGKLLQDYWKDEVAGEKAVDDFKSKEMDILGIKKKDLTIQEPKWLEKQVADDAKIQKKANDEGIKITQEKYKLIGQIAKQAEQIENNIIDGKIQKLEDAKNIELSNANLTATQKTAINKKYADEEAKLKRKGAVADKVAALFEIAINTAVNISNTPLLTAFYIALGAAEAAVVISKPLPSYALGTHSAAGGLSVVGERGRELMISPSGQLGLTGESAELMDIQRGTKIIPSDETKKILNAALSSKQDNSDALQERRHKELVNTIKNKREIILGTKYGHSITERSGNRYREYFELHLK